MCIVAHIIVGIGFHSNIVSCVCFLYHYACWAYAFVVLATFAFWGILFAYGHSYFQCARTSLFIQNHLGIHIHMHVLCLVCANQNMHMCINMRMGTLTRHHMFVHINALANITIDMSISIRDTFHSNM